MRLNQPRLTCSEAEEQLRRNWLDVIGRGNGLNNEATSSNGHISTVDSPLPANKGDKAAIAFFNSELPSLDSCGV